MLSKEQKVKDQEVKFISVEKNYKPKVMNPPPPPPQLLGPTYLHCN